MRACGDGFWEFDLADGSVWFSEWFYRKLAWPADQPCTTLEELRPVMPSWGWEAFMRGIRNHLEQRVPLDLPVHVRLPGDRIEGWQIRGSTERNEAGQPLYLAGSARELPAEGQPPAAGVNCPCGAFASLPVAALLLDAHGRMLEGNRKWRELDAAVPAELVARLASGAPPAEVEFMWDIGGRGGRRHLQVRAAPLGGTGYWVATLS